MASKIIGAMMPISGIITPFELNLISTNKTPHKQSVTIMYIKLARARLKNLPVIGR